MQSWNDILDRIDYTNCRWDVVSKAMKVLEDGVAAKIRDKDGCYKADLEPEKHLCKCDSISLFRYGCKCGGI